MSGRLRAGIIGNIADSWRISRESGTTRGFAHLKIVRADKSFSGRFMLVVGSNSVIVNAAFQLAPTGASITLSIADNLLHGDQARDLVNQRFADVTAPREIYRLVQGDHFCITCAAAILSGKSAEQVVAAYRKNLPRRWDRMFLALPTVLEELTGDKWYVFRSPGIMGPPLAKLQLPDYPFAAAVSQEFPENGMFATQLQRWIVVNGGWAYDPWYQRPISLEEYRRAGWRVNCVLLPARSDWQTGIQPASGIPA